MRERDLFIEALQQGTPAELDAYLVATCGRDDELRRRVDGLLFEHRRQESFILDSASPVILSSTCRSRGTTTKNGS